MEGRQYYRGQIYYIRPRDGIGSEQTGWRPGIIVSNDVGNENSGTVIVVYLTTRKKPPLPTHVAINSAKQPSTALCEQIFAVDKERIGDYVNEVSQAELNNLERALLIFLDIASNIKGSKALETWRKMMESYDYSDYGEDQEPATISSSEDEKEAPKLMETAEVVDITKTPEYIKIAAERDVFKQLYMDLLKERGVS